MSRNEFAGSYTVYGSKQSLYTSKLEAALRFHGLEYAFVNKRDADVSEIEKRAGTHQVPVLQTPENWVVADSTPIIDLIDSRFPARRLFPEGPEGVLVHLVEEYLDEWVARTMVHYRWHYPESAAFAARAIAGGSEEIARMIQSWGPKACRATGTEKPVHQKACEEEYVRLLTAAEAQLAETPFLMGERPTPVDAMILGGLHAHILHDPDPRAIMDSFPRLLAWWVNASDRWPGKGSLPVFPATTAFGAHVLGELRRHYLPVLVATHEALSRGEKTFSVDTYGEEATYLTRPYPVRSWAMIRQRIDHRLTPAQRTDVTEWLHEGGLGYRLVGSS